MSKEEFYKYGESLGIKINDLQRLKMLADACNDRKYTEEDIRRAMKYASEITNNKMKYVEDYINSLNNRDNE